MSQDEFALLIRAKTNSPRITTTKSPNHRNKTPEADSFGPVCLCCCSEQGMVPVILVSQQCPVRTRPWEAAGADRAVNCRQSLTGLGRACRGDKLGLRAVIEELRTAPWAASLHAILLIIFCPNFLILIKETLTVISIKLLRALGFILGAGVVNLGWKSSYPQDRSLELVFVPLLAVGSHWW